MCTRRDFLKMISAGTCGAAIHNVLSPIGGMMAFASTGPITLGAVNDKVLVVVNLSGGCSYNIAPPFNAAYMAKMPTIFPSNPLTLNSEQGLHPSLTALKTIFDEGRLALINLAGHANENRSHDDSTDMRFSAMINGNAGMASGWLARASAEMGGFLNTVSLNGSSLIIQGGSNPGKALNNLDSLGEKGFWGSYHTNWFQDVRNNVIAQGQTPSNSNGVFVQSAMVNLQALLAQIEANTNITLPVAMPNSGIGNQLRDALKLIAAPVLGTHQIFVQQGGYDTHNGEENSLTNLLNELNAALAGFIANLKALNLWDRVMVVTMSEFSRTFENGTQGTDHGHAAPMFVFGGSINGGIKTPPPTAGLIQSLQQDWFDDSSIHVDFRQPFKELVQKMGTFDLGKIFPEPFTNTAYTNLGL